MDPEQAFYAAEKYAGSPDDPVPEDVRQRALVACNFRLATSCALPPGPEELLLQARYVISCQALPEEPGFAVYRITVYYRWSAA